MIKGCLPLYSESIKTQHFFSSRTIKAKLFIKCKLCHKILNNKISLIY